MTRTQGPIEALGDAPDARPILISTIHRNTVAECCGYLKPTGDRAKQGCRDANAQHLAACWNAIEAIGGDPGKVAKMADALEQIGNGCAEFTDDENWDGNTDPKFIEHIRATADSARSH